jgi:vacuolar protein sorting-associated protein 45
MITNSAQHYPASIYNPPSTLANSTPLPGTISGNNLPPQAPPSGNGPALNLRAGGYELSVGGAAGSGLYRASGNNAGEIGASFQIDTLRDGAKSFFDNLRGRVEETVQRVGTPRSD